MCTLVRTQNLQDRRFNLLRSHQPTHTHNDETTVQIRHTQSEGPRQAAVSSGTLFHLWRRNVAVFAPTPKRCRLPGKRCRFGESISLLIVETGLRFVSLVFGLVGIIMNTIHQWILKMARLYGSVQTIRAHQASHHQGSRTAISQNPRAVLSRRVRNSTRTDYRLLNQDDKSFQT